MGISQKHHPTTTCERARIWALHKLEHGKKVVVVGARGGAREEGGGCAGGSRPLWQPWRQIRPPWSRIRSGEGGRGTAPHKMAARGCTQGAARGRRRHEVASSGGRWRSECEGAPWPGTAGVVVDGAPAEVVAGGGGGWGMGEGDQCGGEEARGVALEDGVTTRGIPSTRREGV